ncbi:glutaredoxin-like protein NrdH [Epibacterium sp. DP7N7-1]|nr:glutaredoxin-like protein NrdH [Epibacterium sp. DP7N7-1]
MSDITSQGDALASSNETVVVYTKPNCVQCNATYRSLDAAGISYQIVDLTQDDEAMTMVTGLGYRQAPVVKCGNDHWSGFLPQRIADLKARLTAAPEDDTPSIG